MSISPDVLSAQSRIAEAQYHVQTAQANVLSAQTVDEVKRNGRDLEDAYAELEKARKALDAAQKTAQLVNTSALGLAAASTISSTIDTTFATGIDYGNAWKTAQATQAVGSSALMGFGALNSFDKTLSAAQKYTDELFKPVNTYVERTFPAYSSGTSSVRQDSPFSQSSRQNAPLFQGVVSRSSQPYSQYPSQSQDVGRDGEDSYSRYQSYSGGKGRGWAKPAY